MFIFLYEIANISFRCHNNITVEVSMQDFKEKWGRKMKKFAKKPVGAA